MAKDIKYPLPNLFKLPFPNVLSFLLQPSMIGDQDLDYFEKKEDEPQGITTLKTKEKQNQPTPEPPQNQPTPPSGIDEALELIEENKRRDERFKEVLKMAQGDPDVDYREEDKNRGDYIMEAPQANTFWTTAGFPGDRMNRAKSVIVYITPKDYLELAKDKDEKDYNEKSFELYKNAKVGISIPKLMMNENDDGVFEVGGHEGRHRAKYFQSLDPDTPIPVQVQLTNRGSDEYVDYTRGYYTHGQSVLNAGKKLEESDFVIDENGNRVKINIFGYEGDGQKVGKIFEKDLDKFNEELSNVKVSDQIADFEDDQYGNIGTRGFTEEVAQEIYQAEGYDEYQKKIQEVVRNNLGDTFTVYRGTTTDEFDLEAGEPITRAGVSVSLNPKEAESFVSGKLSLPKKSGDPVLLKITASPEMVVMRGADSGELVLDGYSLNQSNIEIIPIKKEKPGSLMDKPLYDD